MHDAFRDEVRNFLEQSLTPEILEGGRRMTSVFAEKSVSVAWQRVLHAKGWVLVHHETLQTFQAIQRKGKHHRHLSRNTTLCLLVLRLLRLETAAGLTQYPVVSLDTLARRCAELGFQPDLSQSLPELVLLKLIRPAGETPLRPTQPEQLLELLPTLEVAVPASAIESLAPPYRAVFVLRDVDELSTEETAEALDLSIPAVKSRLLRARLQLREKLTRYFKRKGDDAFAYL